MADTQDLQGQHAEGIQHIASNTVPPGTVDTSRGTEIGEGTGLGAGGVSSSAGVGSPVSGSGSELEQTQSQGGIVETVKSYLGMGSGTGTNPTETGQLGQTNTNLGKEWQNNPEHATGSGSAGGVTGAVASAASAIGLGSGNQAAGGGLGTTSSSSAADTAGSSSSPSTSATDTTSSTLQSARDKIQEVTNTQGSKESTSGLDDHKPPQPAGGKPHKMENESAIPTAGGERLGEKHWGESKMVPDNPEKRASEANISSEAGQPTQQTSDNTAANMGGATGPPVSSTFSSGNDKSGGSNAEDKPKMTDKIKDKLHIGKKE